jgi:hypothetical protein
MAKQDAGTDDTYRKLREGVLTFDHGKLAYTGPAWGFLMETGMDEDIVTLAVVADGSVSLYFSNGGGVIGAGQHEGPRRAGLALLASIAKYLDLVRPTKTFPLPRPGCTRFFILTKSGALTAEDREDDLGNGRAPLSGLFHEAHEVITQIRLVSPHGEESDDQVPDAFAQLAHAVAAGDVAQMRTLLAHGNDPNLCDDTGLTGLMVAAQSGQVDSLNLLLEAGSGIDTKDASGYTALMFACNAGETACAQTLIEQGAAVEECDNDGSTPVMFAAQHGHDDIVRLLLAAGADSTREGRHGLSAIGFAKQNGLKKTLKLLQEHK